MALITGKDTAPPDAKGHGDVIRGSWCKQATRQAVMPHLMRQLHGWDQPSDPTTLDTCRRSHR